MNFGDARNMLFLSYGVRGKESRKLSLWQTENPPPASRADPKRGILYFMNDIAALKKYFILEEGVIQGMRFDSSSELTMLLRVSEWNFTQDFFSDWEIPTEHASAYSAIAAIFPQCLVTLDFLNVIWFRIDRLSSHQRPEILFVDVPPPVSVSANDGPWTITGVSFEENSKILEALGRWRDRCTHMQVSAIDMQLELVFETLRIPGFTKRD